MIYQDAGGPAPIRSAFLGGANHPSDGLTLPDTLRSSASKTDEVQASNLFQLLHTYLLDDKLPDLVSHPCRRAPCQISDRKLSLSHCRWGSVALERRQRDDGHKFWYNAY